MFKPKNHHFWFFIEDMMDHILSLALLRAKYRGFSYNEVSADAVAVRYDLQMAPVLKTS